MERLRHCSAVAAQAAWNKIHRKKDGNMNIGIREGRKCFSGHTKKRERNRGESNEALHGQAAFKLNFVAPHQGKGIAGNSMTRMWRRSQICRILPVNVQSHVYILELLSNSSGSIASLPLNLGPCLLTRDSTERCLQLMVGCCASGF